MEIPNGPRGIGVTLDIMRSLVRAGKKTLPVRQAALSLVAGLNQKDYVGEIKAIHSYVRDSIRYVRDINNVETLQTPEQTIKIGQGDCDDKSILTASLLESIGFQTRFIAIGFRPRQYCHVYPEVKIGNKWLSLETTEPVRIGWQPFGVITRMVRHN